MAVPPALQPFVDDRARAALFVDFDGSLAPIVADPAAARPLPAARDALARLVPVLAHRRGGERAPGRVPRDALGDRRARLRRHLRARADRRRRGGASTTASGRGSTRWRGPPTKPRPRCPACWSSARATSRSPSTGATSRIGAPRRGAGPPRRRARLRARRAAAGPHGGGAAPAGAGRQGHDRGRAGPGMGARRAFAGDDAGDLPAFAALHALVDDGRARARGAHRRAVGREPARGARRRRGRRRPGGLAALLGALADAISARCA